MKSLYKFLFLRSFLITVTALCAAVVILWYLVVFYQSELKTNEQVDMSEAVAEEIKANFMRRLQTYEDLLKIIANFTEKANYKSVNNGDFIRLLFKETLLENSDIYQIRYIDATGKEIYRLDREGDEVVFSQPSELQNKKNRYYFVETAQLALGDIYLSPIDLNIENGKIQTPWVPTIRIATPITDTKNGGQGIVILNINLEKDLKLFSSTNGSEKRLLLNKDGYFIAGTDSSDLWGFMFDNNKSFSSYYPTVWNDVIGHDNGTLINEGTIYTFVTINQDDLSFKSDMKKISHSEHFKVVIKRKLSEAQYLPKNSNEVIFALLLFLVIIGISYRWSKAISGQKEAEYSVVKTHEALVQSEKMASLGRLVAGIAHELNTPIGSSVTIASTLQDELRVFENEINSGQIRKSVISHFLLSANSCTDAMMECLERASDLVTHFKRISVDQSTEARRKFTLPDYLNNVIATLEPTFKNRQITIDVYSRDTIEVDSFPGPFAQVISNIINNSVLHGFPSDTAGEIRISVNQNNNDVVITVRDNGVGISPDNLKKIFDPFFTTAADIGGSGLGMSIVYNIISEVLQGDISVNSKINEFTEFVIRMPRYVESMNKPEISHAR